MDTTALLTLFSPPNDPSLLSYGVYDPSLVLLSVLVAIFSSWMGLQIAGQASANRAQRSIVLLTGSLALGSGVWAMHFIGMLAFRLCAVDYDPAVTLLSLAPSVGASFVALSLIGRRRLGISTLLTGGVLVGAGIGAMHYTGMAGMRMSLALRYDPAMFGLSIVVAVVLATLALWVRFGLRRLYPQLGEARVLLASAVVMGCAIAGMHYTGMAAARFVGQADKGVQGVANGTFLALAISLITVAFTVFVLAANGLLRYRQLFLELSRSEAWMRALLTTTVDGVVAVDASGRIEEFNNSAERIFGWQRADIIGRNISVLMADTKRSEQDGLLNYLRSRDHAIITAGSEVLGRHKDGSTVPIRRALGHARLGEQELFVCFITDITERRAAENALREAKDRAEQAAAARATFVANMSHEIRTPMNAILGFTDVLLDGELTPGQRRHLDTVRGAGRSLLRLLNEILDTAKLERGAVELELVDYHLLDLIDELSSTLGGAARAKGLQLDISYASALPTCLHGDELRMRQVLTNLLDNAIKFTAAGQVTLAADIVDGKLHLLVRDSGIGIAPERLEAIFDPFTQADTSMTRRFGGTGLGTTISKQLVELMGGRIWAESVAGEGSSFHVLLPLVPARAAPQSARARTPAVLPPLRVLVADDVAQNVELLALLLARRGHTMQSASDGAAAVAAAASNDFDVILMDVQMPLIDGLDATRAIHAAAAAAGRPRVPVVAMTASVLDAQRRACSAAGMDGFASKPVDWPALSHEMARVLGLDAKAPALPAVPAGPRVRLNHDSGLRRWSANAEAYEAALVRFGADYANLATRLAGADAPQAHALAHKARGAAANLGLEQLSDALLAVESAGHAGHAPADAGQQGLSAALAAALAEAMAAISTPASPPATRPAAGLQGIGSGVGAGGGGGGGASGRGSGGGASTGAGTSAGNGADINNGNDAGAPGCDPAAARRAGRQLSAAFARGALDDNALAALAAAISDDQQDRIKAIQNALADFDFALAQRRLDGILAKLPAPTDDTLSLP